MSSWFKSQVVVQQEVLIPSEGVSSVWTPQLMNGPAITGSLARAIEQRHGSDGFVPVRVTFEQHSPVPMWPITFSSSLLTESRRLKLVEADLRAQGKVYARARSLFLRETADLKAPDNPTWEPTDFPEPPDEWAAKHLLTRRSYWSESIGWTQNSSEVLHSERKGVWQEDQSLIEGELITPFQLVASLADLANPLVNWGERGIEYINADVTLSLSRYPAPGGAGLVTLSRSTHQGLAVGSAYLFDRVGPLGTVSVSSLLQHRMRIRFEQNSPRQA